MNARAQSTRRQTKKSAARTDIEKAPAFQAGSFQHRSQRLFRLRDALTVEAGEKSRPVLAEFEARALGDFDCVGTHSTDTSTGNKLTSRIQAEPCASQVYRSTTSTAPVFACQEQPDRCRPRFRSSSAARSTARVEIDTRRLRSRSSASRAPRHTRAGAGPLRRYSRSNRERFLFFRAAHPAVLALQPRVRQKTGYADHARTNRSRDHHSSR